MDDVKHSGDEARPALHETNWNPQQSRDRSSFPSNFEELSPRSKEAVSTENNEFPFQRGESNRGSMDANLMSAARPTSSQTEPRPSTTGITPDFVAGLRKLIREEHQTMFREERQSIIQEALQEYHKAKQGDAAGDSPKSPNGTKHSSPSQSPHRYSPASQTNELPFTDNIREASRVSVPLPVPTYPALPIRNPQSPTASQASGSPRTSSVRFSDGGQQSPVASRDDSSQNGRTASNRSSVELSVIDQKWGELFNNEGRPTRRLRQVLISLGNYIAFRFLPQNSIVVTPEKLAAFYSYHRLEAELYPFSVIFRNRTRDFNERLADLYQDLDCQYHLVQTSTRSRPTVPCLTPTGFAQWLTTNIQAYPDEEARRLETIVSALPLDVESPLDGKPERLPKQISRHLLPAKFSKRSRKLLDEAMKDFMEDLNIPSSTSPSSSQARHKSTTSESRYADFSTRSRYIPTVSNSSPKDRAHFPRNTEAEIPYVENSSPRGRGLRTFQINTRDDSPSQVKHYYASAMPPPPVGRNSIPRRDRSPQRRPFSQSVPVNIGDDGSFAEPSSTNSSVIFTPSSASNMSPTPELASLRGTDGEYRVHPPPSRDRPSLDDSTPRAGSAVNLRDTLGRGGPEKDSGSNRRSIVAQDSRGPTWDEVLRHQERP